MARPLRYDDQFVSIISEGGIMGAAAYIGRVGARQPEVPCSQLVRGDGPRDHNLMGSSLPAGETP